MSTNRTRSIIRTLSFDDHDHDHHTPQSTINRTKNTNSLGSRSFQRVRGQDSLSLGDQTEGFSLESALGNIPLILSAIGNEEEGDSEMLLAPQKRLLKSIEIVEKVVMKELNRLKTTPTALKAERERKIRTLMSMRVGTLVMDDESICSSCCLTECIDPSTTTLYFQSLLLRLSFGCCLLLVVVCCTVCNLQPNVAGHDFDHEE